MCNYLSTSLSVQQHYTKSPKLILHWGTSIPYFSNNLHPHFPSTPFPDIFNSKFCAHLLILCAHLILVDLNNITWNVQVLWLLVTKLPPGIQKHLMSSVSNLQNSKQESTTPTILVICKLFVLVRRWYVITHVNDQLLCTIYAAADFCYLQVVK